MNEKEIVCSCGIGLKYAQGWGRKIGFYDRANPARFYVLPTRHDETITEYYQRFFEKIRGLGNIGIVYRGKIKAYRGL